MSFDESFFVLDDAHEKVNPPVVVIEQKMIDGGMTPAEVSTAVDDWVLNAPDGWHYSTLAEAFGQPTPTAEEQDEVRAEAARRNVPCL